MKRVNCCMPFVSELYVYPIKSLGGIKLDSAELTDRGFQYDRRWMLVNEQNEFLTQREFPQMALLQTEITNSGIKVSQKKNMNENILVPFNIESNYKITVRVWEDICEAILINDQFSDWFSDQLKIRCKLVYMPDDSIRRVDKQYAFNNETTSFSDGYPILMISEESLADLNSRLINSLPMNRFRPNMVIKNVRPYEEDEMGQFDINGINFYGVKLCSRCVITTTNQDTAEKNKEPLKTLATYRTKDNNVYFGQNVLYNGNGKINTGDTINIIKRKQPVF